MVENEHICPTVTLLLSWWWCSARGERSFSYVYSLTSELQKVKVVKELHKPGIISSQVQECLSAGLRKRKPREIWPKKKKIWALSTWLFHRLWLKKQNYYLMRRLQLKWCQWENIMQKTKLNLKLKLIKWNLVWSRNITSSLTPCCFFNGDVMVNITDELHLWFFFLNPTFPLMTLVVY